MKIISWNTRHHKEMWQKVASLDADVALLQEACEPPAGLGARLDIDSEPWCTDGAARRRWRTSIVGLRAGLVIERVRARGLGEAVPGELGVSRLGTLAAARVKNPSASEWITLVSMYAPWETVHPSAGGDWIFADASAHRVISDISPL